MADLEDLLREHRLQVTAQRLAVLRAVAAQPHSTVDDVSGLARTDIGAISRQAVYDALAAMEEAGLVQRIQPLGSPARFEARVGDNHHHLVCRGCGHVEDVDCAIGEAPCLTPMQDRGYAVDQAEVIYWGQCGDCAGAGAPTTDFEATNRDNTRRSDDGK